MLCGWITIIKHPYFIALGVFFPKYRLKFRCTHLEIKTYQMPPRRNERAKITPASDRISIRHYDGTAPFTRHVTNIIDVARDYVVTKSGSPPLGEAVLNPKTSCDCYRDLYGIYDVGHSCLRLARHLGNSLNNSYKLNTQANPYRCLKKKASPLSFLNW